MPIRRVPIGTIQDSNDPLSELQRRQRVIENSLGPDYSVQELMRERGTAPEERQATPAEVSPQDVSYKPRGTEYNILGYDPSASRALQVASSSPIAGLNFDEVPRSGNSENSREHMGPRSGGNHAGIDIPAKPGTPVVAPLDATIKKMGTAQGYGQYVDAQMSDGTVHRFAHLGDMSKGGNISPFPSDVKPGDRVPAGTPIGFSGYSGNADKDFPHVHAEVFRDNGDYNRYGFSNSRETAFGRLDPRTYYTDGLNAAITKQNELFAKLGKPPGAPPPGGDTSPPVRSSTLPVGGDGVFKSPSGQEIRNGIDPNAPYMSRTRDPGDIKRIVMHGDVVQDSDKLLKYGRQIDPGRGFDPGYHFYIGRDGTVTQGAPLDRVTNHTLGENKDTIGIVVAGADGGRMPTEAQKAAGLRLVSDLGTDLKIDPQKIYGHGELQPNRRNALEGGDIASTIRSGGYLPPSATAAAPPPAEAPASEAAAPKRPISVMEAAGMTASPTAAPTAPAVSPGQKPAPTSEPALMASARTFAATGDTPEPGPLPNQEAQPGAPSAAPATGPGIVTSQAVPPDAISPRLDAPDARGINVADGSDTATSGGASAPNNALDSWKPGQPIMPALLKDFLGIDMSGEGGGGGFFGGGGGKSSSFKNLVQVPNLPDLGQQLLQTAGPEPSSLPTSIPPPPPPPPPTPPGMQTLAQLHQRRQIGRG